MLALVRLAALHRDGARIKSERAARARQLTEKLAHGLPEFAQGSPWGGHLPRCNYLWLPEETAFLPARLFTFFLGGETPAVRLEQ